MTNSCLQASWNNAACKHGNTLGQLFLRGEQLWELSPPPHSPVPQPPMSWYVAPGSNGTEVVVRFRDGARPPTDGDVEATVRNRVFAPHVRGLGHIVVRGFVMEHAANNFDDNFWTATTQRNNPSPAAFAQAGLIGTRSGHHWLIEHNVIRSAKTIGAGNVAPPSP